VKSVSSTSSSTSQPEESFQVARVGLPNLLQRSPSWRVHSLLFLRAVSPSMGWLLHRSLGLADDPHLMLRVVFFL
jgi:hypothetical protein